MERAWYRGEQFGRYKAVDDLLAHNVEAFTGMPELFRFPRDLGRVQAPVNRLNDQKLVSIYTREWAVWTR